MQKRKAQNRAAQRAFRERKEKHLKDLETKVEDLEKESHATTQENGLLRAQVERLQVELKEYRKRLSWVSTGAGSTRNQPASAQPRTGSLAPGSNDFQFQFPKFGDSTQNTSIFNVTDNQRFNQNSSRPVQRTSSVPTAQSASPASSLGRNSVANVPPQKQASANASPANNLTQSPPSYNQPGSMDSFTGLFSPSLLEATRNSPKGYFGINENQANNLSRGSFDNSYSSLPGLYSGSSGTNTESPGSSSDAHNHISSIGTSPEPVFNSPNNKLQDLGLNTINEEGNLGQWNCKYLIIGKCDQANVLLQSTLLANQNLIQTASTG